MPSTGNHTSLSHVTTNIYYTLPNAFLLLDPPTEGSGDVAHLHMLGDVETQLLSRFKIPRFIAVKSIQTKALSHLIISPLCVVLL